MFLSTGFPSLGRPCPESLSGITSICVKVKSAQIFSRQRAVVGSHPFVGGMRHNQNTQIRLFPIFRVQPWVYVARIQTRNGQSRLAIPSSFSMSSNSVYCGQTERPSKGSPRASHLIYVQWKTTCIWIVTAKADGSAMLKGCASLNRIRLAPQS